jgi:hypothetical protein
VDYSYLSLNSDSGNVEMRHHTKTPTHICYARRKLGREAEVREVSPYSGKVFCCLQTGEGIATTFSHRLSLASILAISITRIIFSIHLPPSLSGVGNSALWAVNSTVHFFRVALLRRHDIRTFQASGLLGNVNTTVATSRVTM